MTSQAVDFLNLFKDFYFVRNAFHIVIYKKFEFKNIASILIIMMKHLLANMSISLMKTYLRKVGNSVLGVDIGSHDIHT